ncbi:hypothetical protein K6T82_07275 [Flavobacterium sp. 17A]|uniref:Uncharacterized protein n=1 Tax=Flavobacterium potami TaxID=2872310 RepID=A0A9X1H9E0_9FLAO|nr:hypothetical protein [Flavobacterium potami]MBZ4034562.1 hypothetical protein [Flavobacterium potami]
MKSLKKITFLFFCIAQVSFSQRQDVNQLLIDGEKAYLENNFLLAKDIYLKAVSLGKENKDCWFNLATSELKLEEYENACEHFYQAYLLDDVEALKVIKENCPDFRNGSIMSLNDVEEKPKFIYGKKEYLLIIGNALNPKYTSILRSRFKWSGIMSKYKGSVFVQFKVNKHDGLDVKVLRVSGNQKEAEIIKKEMLSILKDLVVYVSAKQNGVNVDLWDKWSMTFNFLMLGK